jgi:hypothetical protein
MRATETTPPESTAVVAVSEDRHHVLIKITGTINRRSAVEYDQRAHALGRESNIRRYFMDLTECVNVDPAADAFEFAYHDMRADPFDPRARVTALVAPDDHSHDFIETVCRNAGHNVTLFRDRAEALRHLYAP